MIDTLFNLWGFHFLKGPIICICPTVLGGLSEVIHVREQSETHSSEFCTGANCHIIHRQRTALGVFGEKGGSCCMLGMCVSPRDGHSPPCLPFLLDPLPLPPTPDPPPHFAWEIKPKAFCMSECSVSYTTAQSPNLLRSLLFLVWLPKGFRAKSHILTHLTCFSIVLTQTGLLLYQSVS